MLKKKNAFYCSIIHTYKQPGTLKHFIIQIEYRRLYIYSRIKFEWVGRNTQYLVRDFVDLHTTAASSSQAPFQTPKMAFNAIFFFIS